ncbi:hypothetical protein GWK47_011469 [Chionoecetes opilio]|uniref:Uncharacterized protein n=1 Tax=Chionoecetes opilio TaxID=41210 RepID=A0A8J4XWJ8_CHIOP|nr:hypothetical protein GWK47_011469 [Chionoecetes opilio]
MPLAVSSKEAAIQRPPLSSPRNIDDKEGGVLCRQKIPVLCTCWRLDGATVASSGNVNKQAHKAHMATDTPDARMLPVASRYCYCMCDKKRRKHPGVRLQLFPKDARRCLVMPRVPGGKPRENILKEVFSSACSRVELLLRPTPAPSACPSAQWLPKGPEERPQG